MLSNYSSDSNIRFETQHCVTEGKLIPQAADVGNRVWNDVYPDLDFYS